MDGNDGGLGTFPVPSSGPLPPPVPHLVYISVVSVMEAVTWRLPGSGLNFPSARVGALISLGEPLFTQVQAGVRVNTHTHTHTHTHTSCRCSMLCKRSQSGLPPRGLLHAHTHCPVGEEGDPEARAPAPMAGSCGARRSHPMDLRTSLHP